MGCTTSTHALPRSIRSGAVSHQSGCGVQQPFDSVCPRHQGPVLGEVLSADASTVESASLPVSPSKTEGRPASTGSLTFADSYLLGEVLGEGCYGKVYTASSTARGRARLFAPKASNVAVKVVQAPPESDGLRLNQLREMRVWQVVGSSKHCVRLYEAFVQHTVMHLVMERAGCNLLDYVTERKMTSEVRAAHFFGQMLAGIAHCHSVSVIHRDVKPENFLVVGEGDRCVVKLTDFGLSVVYDGDLLTGSSGSAPYLCPEMVLGEGHDMVADVWSLGASAYKLLYGEWLYMPCEPITIPAMKDAIRAGSPLPRFTHNETSKTSTREAVGGLGGWLRQILIRDRSLRPSAKDAQVFLKQCLAR